MEEQDTDYLNDYVSFDDAEDWERNRNDNRDFDSSHYDDMMYWRS